MKVYTRSNFMGMFLCLVSSMLQSLGTLMVSQMIQFHPITKSFWRFAGTFIPSIFVLIYYAFQKESITDSFWPVSYDTFKVFVSLAVRSVFGCTSATLQYYSLTYMPLGDSSVICNSYPVLVSILASLFLGEPFGGLFMLFATLVTLGGVTIVARPPFMFGAEGNAAFLTGACLALGCAFFLAMAIVMIRHLHHIHHSITLVGFGGFGTAEAAALAWGFDVMEFPTETKDILTACAIGLLSCGSQLFLIFALKCDNAGPVALVKTSDVIFAFLWQMVFINTLPDFVSILGAIVMMTGIFLCGFQKYVGSLDENNVIRRAFWFVMI